MLMNEMSGALLDSENRLLDREADIMVSYICDTQ